MNFQDEIIDQAALWLKEGHELCLLTLVVSHGSSPRPVGSQMLVRADGIAVGYITAGCAEAALISEAQVVIAQGQGRTVRFGAGSPYLDIQLPCGSGIDVHFEPDLTLSLIEELVQRRRRRQSSVLILDLSHVDRPAIGTGLGGAALQSHDGKFLRYFLPRTRLYVAGKGILTVVFAQLAKDMGFELVVASPDRDVLDSLDAIADCHKLDVPGDWRLSGVDQWSALVTLFHDHEWEPDILMQGLETEAFYIGALGSRKTHQVRLESLGSLGVAAHELERIYGPIGLDIGAANPPEIALSAIAQIVAVHRGRNG